jgi:hypothetical protein
MDCQRARASMFPECDNELAPDLAVPFHEHLTLCPQCATELDYLRKLLAVVRARCCRYVAPTELKVRIIALLREAE